MNDQDHAAIATIALMAAAADGTQSANERSQLQNRELALGVLRSKLVTLASSNGTSPSPRSGASRWAQA